MEELKELSDEELTQRLAKKRLIEGASKLSDNELDALLTYKRDQENIESLPRIEDTGINQTKAGIRAAANTSIAGLYPEVGAGISSLLTDKRFGPERERITKQLQAEELQYPGTTGLGKFAGYTAVGFAEAPKDLTAVKTRINFTNTQMAK